ncbi:hypothetical protein [Pseudomonas sp. MWU16-30317]|uniref:hypothetical protein n=1 Tax=Pseudomonas sp. MWU16-30317 TaxID=2878095 RepID=UPI001CF9F5B5|nr:hypothetical protein [Pseudomonas sp. MWU16-30317]
MSFDIIILRPTDLSINDLAAVESVEDIGPPASVRTSVDVVFPSGAQGAFAAGDCYFVESALSGDPVTSVHLTLRYGSAWSESANGEFLALLSTLCQRLQAPAYAVSDNLRIASFQ